MKLKVELEPGETMQDADEFLAKAIKKKEQCSGGEKYNDPALEEAHEYMCKLHVDILKDIEEELKMEIQARVSR